MLSIQCLKSLKSFKFDRLRRVVGQFRCRSTRAFGIDKRETGVKLNLFDEIHRFFKVFFRKKRDIIAFLIDGMDVRKFGSQGQQRTVALSLKLAEIELVKRLIQDNPILLLDDVMSELDRSRQDALLESIRGIQTILTCTGYDDFIKERLTIDKVYKVVAGTIQEELDG